MRALSKVVFALVACAPLVGCDEPPQYVWVERPAPPPTGVRAAGTTHITAIDVPNWPPLGPHGKLRVTCSTAGQATLVSSFAMTTSVPVPSSGTLELGGVTLGEGFGKLTLLLRDGSGATAERYVENLLVDMTPPEVEIERTVMRPGDEIAFNVYDAWLLGEVELTIDGQAHTYSFPKLYPAKLGEKWDESRVTFPVASALTQDRKAFVRVLDAAGNVTSKTFDVRIDGTRPVVTFGSPAEAATVASSFEVTFNATDEGPTPPRVDVYVGGGFAGTVSAATGKVKLDATGFSAGPLALDLVAVDEAGNRTTATRNVVLAPD